MKGFLARRFSVVSEIIKSYTESLLVFESRNAFPIRPSAQRSLVHQILKYGQESYYLANDLYFLPIFGGTLLNSHELFAVVNITDTSKPEMSFVDPNHPNDRIKADNAKPAACSKIFSNRQATP